MKLFCPKCYRLTEHGDPKTSHSHPGWMGGPPHLQITARCLTCGYRDKNGYIISARKAS